ncbi:MAG: SEC-C metal-binding domain-containing protein [Opitutaceae bacterium]|nr:SEC-C metal-binding domain-containing protein [Opitutaceae bacterium]
MPVQPNVTTVELRTDQQFGPYANVAPELADDVAGFFEELGDECALDFAGAERVREADRCTVIFPGRQTEVRARLADHGVKVLPGPDTTPADLRYSGPMVALLERGDPSEEEGGEMRQAWAPEHIPELIRMATDEALLLGPSNSLVVWAPLHAMQALGDLAAEEAVGPLAGLWRRPWIEDDDYVSDAVASALGRIGPAALAVASQALCEISLGNFARHGAKDALVGIGRRHPAARAECVAAIAAVLARPEVNDGFTNAVLVSGLLDLKAVEAAEVIERAFRDGRVDESICGDWEDAQIELGLKTRREHPPKPNQLMEMGRQMREAMGLRPLDEYGTVESDGWRGPPESPSLPVRAAPKVGRNEPCPCGSGKKFKKCCGK